MWFLCGAPGEVTSIEKLNSGFRESIVFQLVCGLSAIEKEYRQNDHDYLEALVEYRDGASVPKTFGGMSGGGLWQIIFAQLPDSRLDVKHVHFAGIIFYESPLEMKKRLIRCYGRYSVYKHTIDAIQSKCT
jgi:hypothetical protein